MKTVGVSGAPGSFSEEAALYYLNRQEDKDHELKHLVSVQNVLSAIDSGEIELGIFPIENSNGGIVIEAVHAMSKHIFTIEHMFEIDVRHCLLVKPGTTAHPITSITSHPQALKQCRMYLKRKWQDADLIEYRDTADAARDLGNGTLPATTAVIAPERCATLYGLDVLEQSIQDLKFNFTTFVAATKK